MLVHVDVSDLQLAQNHLFRLFEPYLLDCAINYCASYRSMPYENFHTEMIEYLFDGTLMDEDFRVVDQPVMDRLNDLEEHEFNMLAMISYSIYQRVTQFYCHIWQEPSLKESVLVGYQGHRNYRMIEVEIEVDAPDHLLAALHNRRMIKHKKPMQDLTYIPKGI